MKTAIQSIVQEIEQARELITTIKSSLESAKSIDMCQLKLRLDSAQDELASLYELYHTVAAKKADIVESLAQLQTFPEGMRLSAGQSLDPTIIHSSHLYSSPK